MKEIQKRSLSLLSDDNCIGIEKHLADRQLLVNASVCKHCSVPNTWDIPLHWLLAIKYPNPSPICHVIKYHLPDPSPICHLFFF